MQNIKRIGMRECTGTPKFALHQPCAIMNEIGVVLRLLPKARTDNYIGEHIMKMPKDFDILVPAREERIARQSNNVSINTNGDVRFGQKILNKLFPDHEIPPYVVIGGNKKDTIQFGFVSPAQETDYPMVYSYQWQKKGISGTGALLASGIPEIVGFLRPNQDKDSHEYQWTETRDNVKKEVQRALLIKKDLDGTTGSVTSLTFIDPMVIKSKEPDNVAIVRITTKNMQYKVRGLHQYRTLGGTTYSAKVPVVEKV